MVPKIRTTPGGRTIGLAMAGVAVLQASRSLTDVCGHARVTRTTRAPAVAPLWSRSSDVTGPRHGGTQ